MANRIVDVRGLAKHYPPNVKAVDNIDLQVQAAQVFSLLGPNGAGKTTTVEILEGIRTPTSGRALVFGADVTTDYARIRKRVGVLPQEFEPFDRLTPMEAVLYWARLFDRDLGKEDASRILETVSLSDRRNLQAIHLSGGEKRKLGIAMSLVGEPELLFLDEPTTGLDPRARRDIWGLIESVRKAGATVFLTTHYLDEAERLADDVAIMHRGRVIARGSPNELVRTHATRSLIVLAGAGAEGLREVHRRGIPADLQGGDVLVPCGDPAQMRTHLAKLAALTVPMRDMYTKRETLEDVFLHLVGARMEEGVLAE